MYLVEHRSFILFLIKEIFDLFYFILLRFFFKYYKLFSLFGNPLISRLKINSLIIFYSNWFIKKLMFWILQFLFSANYFDFIIYNWFLFPSVIFRSSPEKSWVDKNNVMDISKIWKIYQCFPNEFIQVIFVLIYCHQFHLWWNSFLNW